MVMTIQSRPPISFEKKNKKNYLLIYKLVT